MTLGAISTPKISRLRDDNKKAMGMKKMSKYQLYSVLCVLSILLSACGGRGTATREELSDLSAYDSNSPYAEAIASCAQVNAPWASCSLTRLPPLAMDVPEPTIDDVMSRVAVSHDWMGLRFRQLLEQLPDDMLYLFGAVTTVVIDDDIRPSYYWDLTGAIYLDPASLWLTLEEKDSINRKLDHRTGNDSKMRLRWYSRQAIDGADAARYYGLDSEVERPLEDIVIPMANLLFHELAHANDQFPRAAMVNIDRDQSISSATGSLYDDYPSTLLKQALALTSELGFALGKIFYRGVEPTDEQQQWSAAEIGQAFAPDGASDNYAYASQYEDLAMLFQDTMMYLYFDIEKEIAFIEAPEQKSPACGEAIIGWGARNRIGDPLVKERAKQVVSDLLPDRDYLDRIDAIAEPTDLSGLDWCAMVNEQRSLNNPANALQISPQSFYAKPWHAH